MHSLYIFTFNMLQNKEQNWQLVPITKHLHIQTTYEAIYQSFLSLRTTSSPLDQLPLNQRTAKVFVYTTETITNIATASSKKSSHMAQQTTPQISSPQLLPYLPRNKQQKSLHIVNQNVNILCHNLLA
eukprot:143898_1